MIAFMQNHKKSTVRKHIQQQTLMLSTLMTSTYSVISNAVSGFFFPFVNTITNIGKF